MRLNTTKSLELARQVKAQYGTWAEVIAASRLVDGVYVLSRPPRPREATDGSDAAVRA